VTSSSSTPPLPGEKVFSRGGRVYIQKPGGKAVALKEPYVHGQETNIPTPITIPKGYYYMLGDNRGDSEDSRVWGPEPRNDILGIARVRYWPIDRIGLL
jgi:signal peptidase I